MEDASSDDPIGKFSVDEWQTMMRFVGFNPDHIANLTRLANFVVQQRILAVESDHNA